MNAVFLVAVVVMLLNVVVGFAFVMRTRGGVDVMLAVLLFGTTGVGLMLVLARAVGLRGGVDVALVLALLAAVLGVAFAMRGWPVADVPRPGEDRE